MTTVLVTDASRDASTVEPSDKLSIFHLKHLGLRTTTFITVLFNDSMSTRRIPAIWKASCCLPTPLTLASGGVRSFRLWSNSPPLRPSGQQCSHSSGVCPQIRGRQRSVYVGAVEEMMCECSKLAIVVMDVIWRQLCVSIILKMAIYLF